MALPLFALALGALAVGLIAKAATSKPGGGGGHTCSMNGEELAAALARLDKLDPTNKLGSMIMTALGNPAARAVNLRATAEAVRKTKAMGYADADAVAECIEARADYQASQGNP